MIVRRAAPGLLFALLVVAVWADPLFTGRNFTGRDLLAYNLPMEKVIHDAYASGSLPVWNPWISGGRPLVANPNAGALYPVRALLSLLPFELALRIYPVLHWVAAGIGVLFLLAALGVGRAGAWVGAATYVFSGASVSEVFYPHIQPGFALLPWLLWALARRGRLGRWTVPLLGALFGLDFLAADVFTAGLAVGACLLWIATETAGAEGRRALGTVAGGVALGALAAAPQIVATALWIPQTNRAVLGMKLAEAFLFSVSPRRLLELVIPYPFGPTWELRPTLVWDWSVFNGKSLGLFSTLFAGSLAPLAAVRLFRTKRPGLSFARWFLAFGLVVSVLPSLIPEAWRAWTSPLPLRNPEKLAVAAALAFAIFAGRAFEEFRENPPRFAVYAVPGAVLALAALAFAVPSLGLGALAAASLAGDPSHARAAAAAIPLALSEAGFFWMATAVALDGARSPRRSIVLASVLLAALVPVAATRRIAEISHPGDVFSPTPFALRIRKWDPQGSFRVLGEGIYQKPRPDEPRLADLAIIELPQRSWTQHTSALWARGTVFNYDFDSGDLARVESLRKISPAAASFRDSAPFFGNLGLKWGIRSSQRPAVSGYRRIGGDAVQDWDEIAPAFPDLRLAASWQEKPGPLEALGALPSIGPGELLLETGRAAAGRARPGTVRVLEKRPNRLRLDVDAPDPGWLFVLRSYWPWRDVVIDGHPADVVPAYLAFSAVRIPAGRHLLDWRERIPGIGISAWGPVLFLLGAAVAARPFWRRTR